MSIPLLIAACVLALIYGTNAGGTIASIGLTVQAFRPVVGILALGIAVALAPLIFGTAVASTLAVEMVGMGGARGQAALLMAVISALLITTALSWFGIPTSLTLALIGGIAGAGLGTGLDVSWLRVALVLASVAIAPLIGGTLANLMLPLFARWQTTITARRHLSRLHIVAFVGLILAFGANDGQKMLAVFSVAAGTAGETVHATWWPLIIVATLFAIGAAIGVRRMAGATNRGVLGVQPLDAVVTEFSTATVMFTSSLFGSPVGMAQTLSGSLVGVGLSKGRGRVRWDYAGRIVNAWAVTMPVAFGVAWVLGAVTVVFSPG